MSYVRSSEQSSEQLLCRAGPGEGRSSVWAGLGAQCGADSQPADMLNTSLTRPGALHPEDKVTISDPDLASRYRLTWRLQWAVFGGVVL